MKIRFLFVAAVITFCFSQISYSQSNDFCGCDLLLKDGAYRKFISTGSQDYKTALAYYVATASYEKYQTSSSGGGGFEVFDLFDFNANMSKGGFEEKQKSLKEGYHLETSSNVQQKVIEITGDSDIINGFVSCKRDCNKEGLHSWLEQRDNKHFTLWLRWTPYAGTMINPVIKDSSITGGKIEGLPQNKVFRPN